MHHNILVLSGLLLLGTSAQAQWVQQPIPFSSPSAAVASIDAVDNAVAWTIGGEIDGQTTVQEFARTSNGGTTWTVGPITGLVTGDQPTSIYALDATTAWVTVLIDTGPSQILKTTNGGTSWTVQTTATQFAGPRSYPNLVHFFNANEGIAAGDPDGSTAGFEIYTTANGGTTWTRVANVPATLSLEAGLGGAPAVVGNTIWFGTFNGRVYYSRNKGLTWAVSTVGSSEFRSLAFRDANNGLALTLDEGGTNHQLARTTDGGVSWSQVAYTGPLHGLDLDNVPGTGQFVSVGTDIGNGDAGSSYSRDNGQTWVSLENTINHFVLDFASSTVAWSGRVDNLTSAGQGVNKLTSTVLGTRAATPAQLGVSVYPNPSADGRFTISAQQTRATIELRVHDALGRELLRRTGPGSAGVPVTLDLSQYKAGLYTLELRTDAGVAQQKLIVE